MEGRRALQTIRALAEEGCENWEDGNLAGFKAQARAIASVLYTATRGQLEESMLVPFLATLCGAQTNRELYMRAVEICGVLWVVSGDDKFGQIDGVKKHARTLMVGMWDAARTTLEGRYRSRSRNIPFTVVQGGRR